MATEDPTMEDELYLGSDQLYELDPFTVDGSDINPTFGFGSGIEDLYGFDELFDPDFIDTDMGLVDGYDSFAAPPPSFSVPRTFDSEETLDISKFKAPETEEEKRGLLGKIGDALSKIPANVLNGLILQAGVKSVGVLPALILSKLTAGAVNDTVTPFVSNALKAIGNTGKDALGNIINFRNPSNQTTTDLVSTDQGAIDQGQEVSSNFQGSEDPFRITDFGSSSITEGNDVFSFDDTTSFVNESEGFEGAGDTFSEVSDNNTSVSNQTNNEMDNESNTNLSGSGQGSSGMDSKLEEYYEILREQGPKAAEIYAQNLDAFVQGVSPILFGSARSYTDEQLKSYGRTLGIDNGGVPTLQEITEAGAKLDPTEGKRITDVLMGSQAASGREFDPSIAQVGIDMNQLMYNRREPFIKASLAASDIAPGIAFGGALAGTMESSLPTFADKYKFDLAREQSAMQERLLEAQEKSGNINTALSAYGALFGPSGAYTQNLFGVQDLVGGTLENLGLGGVANLLSPDKKINRFDGLDSNMFEDYLRMKSGQSFFDEVLNF